MLSNNVLQLTDPACHGPGYTDRDNGAALGRPGLEAASAVAPSQGRASPARS